MATDQQGHNLVYKPLSCLIVDPITHGAGEYDRDFIFGIRRWEFVPSVEVGSVNAIPNHINVESVLWR